MTLTTLGSDVGTTAVKVVALDPEGRSVAEASAAHDLISPRPGWAESDPGAWWTGVVAALRQLGQTVPLASVAIAGVGGLVPALVLLDGDGRVLRPAMLYNDARTGAEVAWVAERIDRGAFFAATGQPLSQQLVAPKLLWISRHEPDVYRTIRGVMGAYDYVRLRLTGEQALEQNWALESGFWDARRHAWYYPVLDATGVPETWLAEVRAPHEVVGRVTYSPRGTLGSAWGVARVAGVAAGWWGWEMERSPDGDEVVHEPAPERADRYDALYRLYRELYAHLKGDFQTARALGG